MSISHFTRHHPGHPASRPPVVPLDTAMAVGHLAHICSQLAAYQREHGPSPDIEAAHDYVRKVLRLRTTGREESGHE